MLEREDRYRVQVSATLDDTTGDYCMHPNTVIWLECGRCPWEWRAEATRAVNLAELNARASEHAEVCR